MMFLAHLTFAQNTSSIANDIERSTKIKDWENAKKKVTNFYSTLPQEPNELQIVAKYEVSKLEKTIDYYLNLEKTLYNDIQRYGSASDCEKYLIDFPYSSRRMEVAYKQAEILNTWSAFRNFLLDYPNSSYQNTALNKMDQLDLEAFNNAKRIGSGDALKAYIDKVFEGNYVLEATLLMIEKYEEEDFNRAMSTNTIAGFSNFINKYPTGKYYSKAQNLLEELWFNAGEKEFKKHNWQGAINGFEDYLRNYPKGSKASEAEKRIEMARRKMTFAMKNITFLSYDYDKNSQIGLCIGDLKTSGTSGYFKMNANKELFSRGGILHTTDNSNYTSGSNDFSLTGDSQANNWSMILGGIVKIYPPVWFYAGGGVLNSGIYYKANEYDSFGDYLRTRWLKNTDQQTYKFVGESGLIFNLVNKAVLKAGITYYNKAITPQFGVGFAW